MQSLGGAIPPYQKIVAGGDKGVRPGDRRMYADIHPRGDCHHIHPDE
jgi:hypothetical protein